MAELEGIKFPIEADDSGLKKGLDDAVKTGDKFRKEELKKARDAAKKRNQVRRQEIANELKFIRQARKKGLTEAQKLQLQELKSFSKIEKDKVVIAQKATNQRLDIAKKASIQQEKLAKQAAAKAAAPGRLIGGIAKVGIGVAAIKGITTSLVRLGTEATVAQNRLSAMLAIVEGRLGKQAIPQAKKILDDLTADGLISRQDIAESIKNLTAFGFSLDQTNEFLIANKDIAIKNREAHFTLGQSIVQVSRGLKNNNAILTDSTGISDNLSTILKKAGLSQNALNDEVQVGSARIAIYDEFLKQAAVFAGDAAAEADKFSGSMSKLGAATEQATITFGSQIAEALKPFVDALRSIIVGITEWFAELSPLSKQIIIFGGILVGLAAGLTAIITGLGAAAAAMKVLGIASTLSLGPIVLVIAAIAALTIGTIALIEATRDENKVRVDTIESLEKVKRRYVELAKKISLTKKEKKELSDIQDVLSDNIEGFIKVIGKEKDAHRDNIKAIEDEIQAQKDLSAQRAKALITDPFAKKDLALRERKVELNKEIGETFLELKKAEKEAGFESTELQFKFEDLKDELEDVQKQIDENADAFDESAKAIDKSSTSTSKSTKKVSENLFALTQLELQVKTLTDQYEEFRKSLEGTKFPEEGLKRFNERLQTIVEQQFGFKPGIFQDVQRDIALINIETKKVNESEKTLNRLIDEEIKKRVKAKELTTELKDLQRQISDNAKERRLSLEFEKANITLQKMNDGLAGFRDTIQGIASNDIPSVVAGLGGIVGVFDKAVGGIISAVGSIIGIVKGIFDILTDNTEELEEQRREQERLLELQEARLEKLKAEQKLLRDLIKLEQDRKQINIDFLDLNDQLNEALGVRKEVARAETAELALAEAQRIQARAPELKDLDITTAEGLRQAADILKDVRLKNVDYQGVLDLASSIQGSIAGLSISQLKKKINELENALAPVADIDQKQGKGAITNAIKKFREILEVKKQGTTEAIIAAGVDVEDTQRIQSIKKFQKKRLKKLEKEVKGTEFGFETAAAALEAQEADLVDIIRLATKGVGINAELAVQKVEDIIESKARRIEKVELFEEDPKKRAEQILAIETEGLQDTLEAALETGIDFKGIDLLSKKGFGKLLRMIDKPGTDEFQKAILLLIKDQIGTIKTLEESSDINAETLNNTLLEFQGERGLQAFVDISRGFLRDALGVFQVSSDAVSDLALPESLGGISQALASTGKVTIQEQTLESINELVNIQIEARDLLAIISATGLTEGVTQDQFDALLVQGLANVGERALV